MPLGRIALCSVKGIIKIREYEKEVTGNGYIDLTDAVVNKLLELKAYGGCTQASTPTPTTPVDIVCNNGTLKVKDKELPVGYVRLESITFDAGPYYITNEKLYGSDVVSMRISQNGSSGRNVFGAYTSNTSEKNFSFYAYPTATGQAYLRYGDTLYRPVVGTGTKSLTFGSGGTTGFATNVTIPEQTFETEDVAYIGHLPNSSSSRFDGTFYGNIEVSSGGTTRLKWIPCKRKSDGVIGYYEVVNGNFIEPSGSGTPTAGAEDYSNIEVYVDGTTEKINSYGGNLIDLNTVTDGYYYDAQGNYTAVAAARLTDYLPIEAGKDVKIYFKSLAAITTLNVRINIFNSNKVWQSQEVLQIASNTEGTKIITPTSDGYIRVSANYSGEAIVDWNTASVTDALGTATCEDLLGVGDYLDEQEILSGNVITKVGVMVLDGTENWTSSGGVYYAKVSDSIAGYGRKAPICTHYVGSDETNANMPSNSVKTANNSEGTELRVYVKDTAQTSTANFTQYLEDQLNAGTPVIVVYPLATPTTLSVAGQHLSIPAGDSRIEIVEGSILNLPLYAKYKSTTE